MNKGAETRDRILRDALSLATIEGLEGLTFGTLAREVGMSKSGLYAHFDSKQDLQLQILERAVESFVDRVVSPALREPRGIPRIRSLFERWIDWEKSPELPGGCPFVAAAHELDDRPGPLRDRLVGYQRDWIDSLATAARIAVEEGHFRADLDPHQFAYDLYASILSYHYFSRLLRDPEAEERARNAFERLLAGATST